MKTLFSITRFEFKSSVPQITQSGNTLNANVAGNSASFQWFLNGEAISNAVDSVYDATKAGIYSVMVTNTLGCSQTDDLDVFFAGIENKNTIDGVAVFLNPVMNDLMVRNLKAEALTSEVYNLNGRLLTESKTPSPNHILPFSNLAKGTYILEMRTKSKVSRNKIIKQ